MAPDRRFLAEGLLVNISELTRISNEVRFKLVQMSHQAESAHLAGALSCVDLLVALYWNVLKADPKAPHDPNRDRLIFSKGHAVSALYAVLAKQGWFAESYLDHYNEDGGHLPEQPSPGCAPGVEWATGSLGHGLGVGLGMALTAKIQKRSHSVFVLMSDGECEEGSVWEAAMLAPKHKLDNLVAIVDFNKWQATGRTTEIMQIESLKAKWEAFGWNCHEINGHNFTQILDALAARTEQPGKPLAIVAHTVKGRGVSFIEDDNNWHYRCPNADEVKQAELELHV
jgi:transketolase